MRKKLITGAVLLAIVLAVVGFVTTNSYAQSFFGRDQSEAAEGASEGPILPPVTAPDTVVVEARVVPNRAAGLSMPASGIVAEVLAAEGAAVTAGTPLVRLHDARQQAAVAQAEANLRNAESNLARLQAPPRSEEVARYQASVTSAQAALQQVLDGPGSADRTSTRVDLANAEAALREAQANYDEVAWRNDLAMLPQATALEQATNNYVRAQAAFDELEAGADAEDVVDAQARVRSAQADLNLLLAGSTPEEIAAAEANVAAAEAALRDAQVALADLTLRAPFDGIVAAVNVEVGEQVSPGIAVVQLADLSRWRLETEDLTELNVVDVQPGNAVELSFDTLPGEAFGGRVTNIWPRGEDKLGDITYTVVVELDEQDSRLRWNMTAEARILSEMAAPVDTQPVPAAAVEPAASAQPAPMPRADALALAGDAGLSAPAEPAATPATTSGVEPVDRALVGTVTTLGANLNVRAAPSTSSAVIAQAPPAKQLQVAARNAAGDWLQVDLAEGQTGWVAAAYVRLDGTAEDLPVVPTPTMPAAQPVPTGPAAAISAPVLAAAPAAATRPLVFQSSSGGTIYGYDPASGALWPIATGMDPALSPDGQTVAFVREGGEHGLYLAGVDGSNLRRIYSGGEALRSPSWSRDGRWIVFSRLTGSYDCRELPGGNCYPDNPFLEELPLVGKEARGLSVVDTDGNQFRDLAALTTAQAPAWGPGGIAYQSRAGLQLTADAPGATTQVLLDSFKAQDPAWSPDGTRIAYQSQEGNHREIFVANADGSGATPLTRPSDLLAKEYPQNVAPVWSSDGQRIAFLSNRTDEGGAGAWGIWTMDADGSNLARLPVDVAIDYRFQAEQALSW